MKILTIRSRALTCAFLTTLGLATAHAQTTANWIGPATGGEWNTGANWDTGSAPADTTFNAFIGKGSNVSYSLPMTATSFGALFSSGILNINTNGFNSTGADAVIAAGGGAQLWINTNGVMNVTGTLGFASNSIATVQPGGTLIVSGNLNVGSNPTGGNSSPTAGAFASLTNNGGTITVGGVTMNSGNATVTGNPLITINAGTNNLGAVDIGRPANSSQNALGADGLIIKGGYVNMTSLRLGNNNFATMLVSPGTIVTNTGNATYRNATANRPVRMLQTGGIYTTIGTNLFVVSTGAGNGVTYSVTGGTNFSGGFQFGDTTVNPGTVNFTNAATIFVGAQGMGSNGIAGINLQLASGGVFGASADWTNTVPVTLNGGSFDLEDATGTPHNIYNLGNFRGSGALIKTGPGTLTLAGSNTFSGIAYIKSGTLAMAADPSGSVGYIASGNIIVGAGTTFDVTLQPTYSVNPLQTLGGFGTVNGPVLVAPTGIINAGSNTVAGTLTFNNDLTETNAAVNHFDFPGDAINILGALNVSGSNVVEIVNGGAPGTVLPLFHYGTFNGSVSSFNASGASGIFSNSVTDKTIYLVVTASLRGNTNVTWVGNSTANDWDTHNLTNWVDGGVSPLDFFLAGDVARFDNLGGNNTNVNIPGTVTPASVIVNSTSNYVFSGIGMISGPNTTLTKTNSGNLTILSTNTYAGATTFAGGVVDVLDLENGGIASPLGSGAVDPALFLFNGGTLEYLGGNKTIDRGATFQTGGGTLSITNGTTLTVSGSLTGTGALTKIGNGQLTLPNANSYQGGTVINAGTIRAAQGTSATITALGTNTITLNGTTSAAAFTFGGDAEVLNNPLHIVNTNNFIFNGGNDQVLDITGSGVLNLEGASGNVFTIAGDMSTFNGTIFVDTISNARFLPNSGTLVGSPNVIFNLGTGSCFLNNRNGNLTVLLGSVVGGTSTTVQGASSTDNRPTTYIIGLNNADNEFDGKFTEVSGLRKVNLVKSGTGTFLLTAANPYTGFTTVSNGVLALAFGTNSTSVDGNLDNTTNIQINATGILDVSGRSDGTLNLGSGQTLSGSGVLRGALSASGTVAPNGGSPNTIGTLTVTNFVNLLGTTSMKLSHGGLSDKLVAPNINLGGTLVVTTIGGPLHVGDTFTLFQGALANGFGQVILPNYYTFDTSQLSVNGTITVTSVTLPVMTTDFSTFSSGVITFNITGGIPGNGVGVLSSTNIALPLANWTSVTNGNFDGSGVFNAPIAVDRTVSPSLYYIMATQ